MNGEHAAIGILGSGAWGVALARLLLKNGHEVTLWSKFPEEIEKLKATRTHPALPGLVLPEEALFTCDLKEAAGKKDIVLMAMASVGIRETAAQLRGILPDGQVIVSVAKGIEAETLMTMSEVIQDELSRDGKHGRVKLVALSGPTHAEEIALDKPSSIVSACTDMEVAELVQDVFMNTCLRTYTNTDVLGVELCGAMKNIMALAVGISTGLGFGDNARAALITRGMAEISRLGLKMGCNEHTFNGLAGIGDLIVTATSMHSRNNRCGILLGQGKSPEEAVRLVGATVEGINALPAAMKLAKRYDVELPIASAVNAVTRGEISAADMAYALMTRDKTQEMRTSEADVRFEYALMRQKAGGAPRRVLAVGEFRALTAKTIAFLTRAADRGGHLTVLLMGEGDIPERRTCLEALRCVNQVLTDAGEGLDHIVQSYRIDEVVRE